MNSRYIITDITSLTEWNRPPVGIIRTQLEWTRYLLEQRTNRLFVKFDNNRNSIFEVPDDEVREIVDRLSSISYKSKKGNKEAEITVASEPSFFKKSLDIYKNEGGIVLLKKGCKKYCPKYLLNRVRELYFKIKEFRLKKSGFIEFSLKNSKQLKEFISPEITQSLTIPSFLKKDAIFVSLGLDWDHSNYQLLYWLKKRVGFEFVGAFYDGIPILRPELLASEYFSQRFFVHFYYLAHLSDRVFAISNHSKSEFELISKEHRIEPPELKTIYLGNTIPKIAENYEPPKREHSKEYIIYVSTIESRKNHKLLIDVWQKFIKDGVDVPDLILIGMQGWGVEEMMRIYEKDKKLQKKVHFYRDVDDDELSYLYQNSKFTLFPSLAEGWGLGAIESLLFGKVCLISTAPSLVEATQNLMPSFEVDDVDGWSKEIQKLCEDEDYLKSLEKRIEEKFISRSWEEFGEDFYKFVMEGR